VAAARPVVVARADTPTSVLAKLRADGGGRPTTYVSVREAFDATAEARADSLALLVAIGVALVALTHLAAWLASQMARRRSEVAGLRAAGLLPRVVRRAYLVEAVALAAIVLVTAGIAAAATTTTLLRPMRLVGGWAVAPAVDLAVRPWVLTPVALGVAVVTAVCCAVVFTRFGRSARPAALREADR
jgi:ABC-type lipoprotein release transport system permease subunit